MGPSNGGQICMMDPIWPDHTPFKTLRKNSIFFLWPTKGLCRVVMFIRWLRSFLFFFFFFLFFCVNGMAKIF